MKRLSKEDFNYYTDILSLILEIVAVMVGITFLVFVWVSTHHIEEVLEFLSTKIPY